MRLFLSITFAWFYQKAFKVLIPIALLFSINFNAQSLEKLEKNIIGTSEKWTVIKASPNGSNTCYAILYSESRTGNQKQTEEKPYLMVHYFSHQKMRFSLYFGYKLVEKRDVNISIDSIPHKLQSFHEYAIAKDFTQDMQIITSLKTGNNLLVRGEGDNFAYSVDKYTITGFTEALSLMEKKCSFHSDESSFQTIVPQKEHLKKVEDRRTDSVENKS